MLPGNARFEILARTHDLFVGWASRPGDLLHADINGIVSIPLEILNDIPAEIDKILAGEQENVKRWRSEGIDLEAERRALEH